MKVIVMEPNCELELREIENDYKDFQALVGGEFTNLPVILGGIPYYTVSNDEGLIHKLPLNKYIVRNGRKVDKFVGTIVFTKLDESDCTKDDLLHIKHFITEDSILIG